MKAPTTLSVLSPSSFTNAGVPRSKRRAARNGPMKKFERTGCTNSRYTACNREAKSISNWNWPNLYVAYIHLTLLQLTVYPLRFATLKLRNRRLKLQDSVWETLIKCCILMCLNQCEISVDDIWL